MRWGSQQTPKPSLQSARYSRTTEERETANVRDEKKEETTGTHLPHFFTFFVALSLSLELSRSLALSLSLSLSLSLFGEEEEEVEAESV